MKNLNHLLGLIIAVFTLTSAVLPKIELETKTLLKDKIELKIPKTFETMSKEMLKTKYPSANRPTLVYTNKSGEINVALNLTKNKASQELISKGTKLHYTIVYSQRS